MIQRTLLNPHRVPNVAKYNAVAKLDTTWARLVNSINFGAPNGCWEWTKSLNEGGYGLFSADVYGNVLAHRLALHVAGRVVPADKTVDHLCRNRKCVNPDHLDIVSNAVNILRGNSAGGRNKRKTHCKWGHEFTPENTYIGKSRTKIGTPTRVCKACARNRYLRSRAE